MKLRIRRVCGIDPILTDKRCYGQMVINVEMTEAQMHDAILEFQTKIPGETWGKWMDEWSKED